MTWLVAVAVVVALVAYLGWCARRLRSLRWPDLDE